MTDATVPTGTATPFAVWSRDADARPGTPLLVLLQPLLVALPFLICPAPVLGCGTFR